ncbi:MAG: hypothetical protein JOY83_14355 [Alphaproteobacteria bacterium]|nr:hypothetical protein [Alphaproteobacteria bacterium]
MKIFYSHQRIMGVALALLASGLGNTVEAQPAGAGGLVAHYPTSTVSEGSASVSD